MPKISWLYSVEDALPYNKELGNEVRAVKHLLSALFYKNGIKGMAIRIAEVKGSPELQFELHIDNIKAHQVTFSPIKKGDFSFELQRIVYPKQKIELFLTVNNGIIALPTATIGNGMSFILKDNNYIPTTHLSFGLIVPQSK